jgi:hypothetical protein
MTYLGDFNTGGTVTIQFTTHAQTGAAIAPSTAFEAADVRLYKNGSAVERTSTSGWTMTSPFDSITGLHQLQIDLSDNTDPGFYAAGGEYTAVLSPDTETVDALSVVSVIGRFSIERITKTNLVKLNGATYPVAQMGALFGNEQSPGNIVHMLQEMLGFDSLSESEAENDDFNNILNYLDSIARTSAVIAVSSQTDMTIALDTELDSLIDGCNIILYETVSGVQTGNRAYRTIISSSSQASFQNIVLDKSCGFTITGGEKVVILPPGFGALDRTLLKTQGPKVIYVKATGNDTFNSGLLRESPKATLTAAHSAAQQGDTIWIIGTITTVNGFTASKELTWTGDINAKITNSSTGFTLSPASNSIIKNITLENNGAAFAGQTYSPLDIDNKFNITVDGVTLIGGDCAYGARVYYSTDIYFCGVTATGYQYGICNFGSKLTTQRCIATGGIAGGFAVCPGGIDIGDDIVIFPQPRWNSIDDEFYGTTSETVGISGPGYLNVSGFFYDTGVEADKPAYLRFVNPLFSATASDASFSSPVAGLIGEPLTGDTIAHIEILGGATVTNNANVTTGTTHHLYPTIISSCVSVNHYHDTAKDSASVTYGGEGGGFESADRTKLNTLHDNRLTSARAALLDRLNISGNVASANQLAVVTAKLPSKSYLAGTNNSTGDINFDDLGSVSEILEEAMGLALNDAVIIFSTDTLNAFRDHLLGGKLHLDSYVDTTTVTPLNNAFAGSSSLSSINGFYSDSNCNVVFTSGTLQGLCNPVIGYNGTNKTLFFDTPWPSVPLSGDTFVFVGRIS